MNTLRRLIREVHRRSLWQVLGIYVVGSWVALQVVDVLKANFGLPEWFPAFALALLVIGLPIVLATAFVQEGIGPRADSTATEVAAPGWATSTAAPGSGVSPAAPAAGGLRGLFTWRNAILGGLAAFSVWGVVATAWLVLGAGPSREAAGASGGPGKERPSIAVLPFANRSGEEGSEFFVGGVHDDLLTQLSKVGDLKVISRASVMQFENSRKPAREIAAALNVATILEGSVQRAGGHLRVNVQLIDARTDEHLWAETYDEELTTANLFAIQTDLARKITRALEATLTPETDARLETRPTGSLEALDLYARARYALEGPRGDSKDGLEEVRDLLERAIAADSGYAQAWALLARVYWQQYFMAHLPKERAAPVAWAAVNRALELDPELAEAHAYRGRLLHADLKYDEAETEFRRALELTPGSAELRNNYRRLLLDLDRYEEAVREARRAVELDPLSPSYRASLAGTLAWVRDWAGTVTEARTLIEMHPEEPHGYYFSGLGHAMLGEHAAAIAAYAKGRELDPSDAYLTAAMAWAYAHAGVRDSALAVLRQVPEQGAMLKEIAIVYGVLGDLDTAYDYLDRVAEEDPGVVGELRNDPTADAIRADPRWGRLLERVGLE